MTASYFEMGWGCFVSILYRYSHHWFSIVRFIDDSNSENEGQLRLVDGRDESEVHFRL